MDGPSFTVKLLQLSSDLHIHCHPMFTFTCTSFVDSAGAEDPLREWTRGKGPLSDLSRRAALLLAVEAIGYVTEVQCGAAA